MHRSGPGAGLSPEVIPGTAGEGTACQGQIAGRARRPPGLADGGRGLPAVEIHSDALGAPVF